MNRIRVVRLDDFNKKEVLHGYLSVREQSESRLAELWGGGQYKIVLIGPDVTGREVYQQSTTLTVLGAYKRPAEIYNLPNAQPTPAPSPGGVASTALPLAGGISAADAMDQIRFQQLLHAATREAVAPPPSAVPWKELMDIGLRIVEMFANRRSDATENATALTLARLEEKINRPPTGPVATGVQDMATAMSALLDIRERITDGGEPKEKDSGLTGMMGDLLKLLAQRQQQTEAPGAPALRTDPRMPGKVEVPMTPRPVDSRPMWQQLLHQYRSYLVRFARSGADPEWVVETILNLVPDDLSGVLKEFVTRPDAAAVAVQEIPELAEFPTFNAALWDGLRVSVLGEDTGEAPA